MPYINLLPWRERMREERRREFLSVLVGVIIIAGGLIFLVDRYFNREIEAQTDRNEFLRTEITVLDARVAEINELRRQKEEIRDRMNVITDLQGTRPVIVRVFDEMVNTLPEGVYYTNLERTGDDLSLIGVSETYSKLTELMRRLDDSQWFANAGLSEISASGSTVPGAEESLTFTLTLSLELPREQEEEQV